MRRQNHEDVSMAPGGREQVRFQCPLEGALRYVRCPHIASGRRFDVAGSLTVKLVQLQSGTRACRTSRVPVAADRRC